MVEQDLDEATQVAVAAWLRRKRTAVLLLTCSSAILNSAERRPDEVVLFCPANHSLPHHMPSRVVDD